MKDAQTEQARVRSQIAVGLVVSTVAVAVYWMTAYPSITWWDSSSYSLVTTKLGVIGPPGSLMLTLMGWPVAHLPWMNAPAYALNLFAGALAALTIALVLTLALRILTFVGYERTGTLKTGAAIGTLTLAFTNTFWEYAVQYTPYILTATFTTLILHVMMRWWESAGEPDSWKQLALLGLLFGLDFSVHRTNSLLIPSALTWILIRRPKALLEWRAWVMGSAALILGISTQLLLILISRVSHSPVNWNDTSTLNSLWHFVSLQRLGGNFLVSFFPRNAPFVSVQVADVARTLRDNFVTSNGAFPLVGALVAIAAVYGMGVVFKRNRKLGTALLIALLLQVAMTVLYFNIPKSYFRSLDRHYLPICIVIGVLIACAIGAGMQRLANATHNSRMVTVACAMLVVVALPGVQLVSNWRVRNASNSHFADDYALNALRELPPNAIYFTVGDNDTFPLLYLQAVEGVRRDVQVVNFSLLFDATYVEQLIRANPAFPLSATRDPRHVRNYKWGDSTLTVPVSGSAEGLGVAADVSIPAAISFHPQAAYSDSMMLADLVLVDLLRTNSWRRPITYSTTGFGSFAWLAPFARLDGLFYRVVPQERPPINVHSLRASLWRNNYRGYADSTVQIDAFTRNISGAYYHAFEALLDAHVSAHTGGCQEELARILSVMPPERIGRDAQYVKALRARCD